MEPLVSILIPAYNSGQWIAGAMQSALAQTWRRTEIVVVDDGSTDGTFDIVRGFASRRVKIATQENGGASAARNTAYSLCQGDYIQWLDADDELEPRKIEHQLRRAYEDGNDQTLISGAWGQFAYRLRKARFRRTALWSDLDPAEWLFRKMSLNLHMQTDNWLVSRRLSEAAGPWDTRLWRDNDGEYFCRVIKASEGIRFVEQARSYYRKAGVKSISYVGGSSRKLESLLLSMKLHIECLRSMEDSPRTRAACVTYINNWLHEFYPFRRDLAAQLGAIIVELGGEFVEPRLSWKYDWIVRCFGWRPGRRAQLALPRLKHSATVAWDRLMGGLETTMLGKRAQGLSDWGGDAPTAEQVDLSAETSTRVGRARCESG
jgi:glycosyltransferase involved in cell wall biosynthesis